MLDSSNKKKYFCWKTFGWASLIIFVIFLLLSFPVIFNFFAIHFWHVPETELSDFTKLGSLGDIYGSLNTIFTSATLAFVVYATLLQRQANSDAREAMAQQLQQAKDSAAEQLQQAKDALIEQLKQAREDTDKQIQNEKDLATIQLKQASEATDKQLDLAKKTHEAQIQETRNSFFTAQFYNLLNLKNEKFKELLLCDKNNIEIKGHVLFRKLANILRKKVILENKSDLAKVDKAIIRRAFLEACNELNNNENYFELFAYFESYGSLIKLINDAKLMKNDKEFFLSILRRSMISNEQRCIFLLAPMWERLFIDIKDAKLFNTFDTNGNFGGFALNFYNKNSFANRAWYEFFKENKKNDPA